MKRTAAAVLLTCLFLSGCSSGSDATEETTDAGAKLLDLSRQNSDSADTDSSEPAEEKTEDSSEPSQNNPEDESSDSSGSDPDRTENESSSGTALFKSKEQGFSFLYDSRFECENKGGSALLYFGTYGTYPYLEVSVYQVQTSASGFADQAMRSFGGTYDGKPTEMSMGNRTIYMADTSCTGKDGKDLIIYVFTESVGDGKLACFTLEMEKKKKSTDIWILP